MNRTWHPAPCGAWSDEHECAPPAPAKTGRTTLILVVLGVLLAGAVLGGVMLLATRTPGDSFLALESEFTPGHPEGGSTTLERHGDVCLVVQTWPGLPTPEGVQSAAQHYPDGASIYERTDCQYVMLVVRVVADGLRAEEVQAGTRCPFKLPCTIETGTRLPGGPL